MAAIDFLIAEKRPDTKSLREKYGLDELFYIIQSGSEQERNDAFAKLMDVMDARLRGQVQLVRTDLANHKDDVMGEFWLHLYSAILKRYDPQREGGSSAAFMYSVFRHVCLDRWRYLNSRKVFSQEDIDSLVVEERSDVSTSHKGHEAVELMELFYEAVWPKVRIVLGSMPNEKFDIYFAHKIRDFSQKECSEAFLVPQGTVASASKRMHDIVRAALPEVLYTDMEREKPPVEMTEKVENAIALIMADLDEDGRLVYYRDQVDPEGLACTR